MNRDEYTHFIVMAPATASTGFIPRSFELLVVVGRVSVSRSSSAKTLLKHVSILSYLLRCGERCSSFPHRLSSIIQKLRSNIPLKVFHPTQIYHSSLCFTWLDLDFVMKRTSPSVVLKYGTISYLQAKFNSSACTGS